MTVADSWDVDDRALIEVATLPFAELVQRAHQHDVAAVNHLYSAYTRLILHRKATKVCSHLSHLGGKCLEAETNFSHAYDSSLQYAIEKVFGMTPVDMQENLAISERGQFEKSDIKNMKDSRPSAVRQIVNQLDSQNSNPESDLIASWGQQVNSFIKTGFVDESRRRWNSDRRLAQRIDQKSYFVKPAQSSSHQNDDSYTDLFKKFVIQLDTHSLRLSETDGQQARQILNLISSLKLDLRTPEGLLLFLRVLYFDACENTYTHNYPIDEARMRRSLVRYEIIHPQHINEIELGSITSLVVVIEECLRLSYAKSEIEQQAILFNLRKARDATRIFDLVDSSKSDLTVDADIIEDSDMFVLEDGNDFEAEM